MKKQPPNQNPPETTQLFQLRSGYPQDAKPETASEFQERFLRFASDMVDFEWRYKKNDADLEKVGVSNLNSLQGKSGLKFKQTEAPASPQNVTPLKKGEG